jgi:hypothetical protein
LLAIDDKLGIRSMAIPTNDSVYRVHSDITGVEQRIQKFGREAQEEGGAVEKVWIGGG